MNKHVPNWEAGFSTPWIDFVQAVMPGELRVYLRR
jgi:hypothetical protein